MTPEMSPEMAAEGRAIAKKLAQANARREAVIASAKEFVVRAHDAGATEVEIAKLLGVDRARTLRRWLGKA